MTETIKEDIPEAIKDMPKTIKDMPKTIKDDKKEVLDPWYKSKSNQAFSLAVIIISAYVFFFGVIVFQARPDGTGFNYNGMKDLTATFGIIAAAVVGYYFGQKNLEEATKTAETATKMYNVQKTEAKKADDKLKKEGKAGLPYYKTMAKITDPKEKDKTVEQVVKEIEKKDLETVNKDVKERIEHIEGFAEKEPEE
ncbi:MAG TPA: hypothetical protein VIP29_02445 [Nitrososphaeraceae archaeon]